MTPLSDDIKMKIIDRKLDTWDMVFNKLFSGRFLAIVIDSIVFPAAVIVSGILAWQKIIEPATFISILGTYGLLVQKTRERYFDMGEIKTKGELNEKRTVTTAGPDVAVPAASQS